MLLEKLSSITTGALCINCNCTKLYRFKTDRIKCSNCSKRYSLKKLSSDIWCLYYFSIEATANKTSKELKVNYRTVLSRYTSYRQILTNHLEVSFHLLKGEIECDESYFGGHRKGHRGRGSTNKIIVLGLLERKGNIYTTILENVKASSLLEQIKSKSDKGSVFYTDQFRSYKSLKFYRKHLTIDHSKEFVKGRNHINGLEGFWSYAKERLLKYHGVSKDNFYLYLKELEFRYNHRKENVFELLLKIIYNYKVNL